MNKIIIRVGLLFFSLAVIFFLQRGMPLTDILIRSVIVFFTSTILMSAVALVFVKSMNKFSVQNKNNSSMQN